MLTLLIAILRVLSYASRDNVATVVCINVSTVAVLLDNHFGSLAITEEHYEEVQFRRNVHQMTIHSQPENLEQRASLSC